MSLEIGRDEADLEALVVAAYVFADEYPVRSRPGRRAQVSDAELVALSVCQAAMVGRWNATRPRSRYSGQLLAPVPRFDARPAQPTTGGIGSAFRTPAWRSRVGSGRRSRREPATDTLMHASEQARTCPRLAVGASARGGQRLYHAGGVVGGLRGLIGVFVVAVAVATLAMIWPIVGTASPNRSTNSATYTDPPGDPKSGPDVRKVIVSDDGLGKITFTVTVPNRPSLTEEDAIQAFFDTDRNTLTGGGGYEYEVAWISGHQVLMHWDGSAFTEVKAASFTGSYKDGEAMFGIDAVDFGGSTSFGFIVTTTGDGGNSLADRAPDRAAVWTYPLSASRPVGPPQPAPPGSPPVRGSLPRLKTLKPKLPRAVAGKPYTVSMIVTDASTKTGVKGKLTCQAKLSGRTLAVSTRSMSALGQASCTWRLPVSARGRRFTGSLTETYKGATAARSFSVPVR